MILKTRVFGYAGLSVGLRLVTETRVPGGGEGDPRCHKPGEVLTGVETYPRHAPGRVSRSVGRVPVEMC